MKNIKKKVVIIDYKLGNLFSVKQACDKVGINARISADRSMILGADALILPGVGAFSEAMKNLEELKLISAIKDKVNKEAPLFGICLGLQLLFTKSEEFGISDGLDIIPGSIKKFPTKVMNKTIKVPHIAWNKIKDLNNKFQSSFLTEINDGEYMYFVHSYFVDPIDKSCILTTTNYDGIEFCSAIMKNNIFATQFHPEKSAEKGLSIYKNWASFNNLI
jgi:glutamine amidotransferase